MKIYGLKKVIIQPAVIGKLVLYHILSFKQIYLPLIKILYMRTDAILENITTAIHRQDPTAQAFLFGSRARGDNRPDSDWDILILIDSQKVTNEIEDQFRDDLYNIELESGQIISTFIYPKSYWQKKLKFSPLYKMVKKEGIKL